MTKASLDSLHFTSEVNKAEKLASHLKKWMAEWMTLIQSIPLSERHCPVQCYAED